MRAGAFTYLLSNWNNTVLYTGSTNNLKRRVAEHKAKVNSGFTEKYNCDKLVYFEAGELMTDAIARERQLKNWKRAWKDELVVSMNPDWIDLSESIGVTQELIDEVAAEHASACGDYLS